MQEKTNPSNGEKINKNVIVVDTNVLINDPGAIAELRKGGNLLCIPWTVIMELDKLKKIPGIKFEVQEAIRGIDKLREAGDSSLIIERGMHFSKLNLDKNVPDHQIIATLNYVLYHFSRGKERPTKQSNPYSGYDKVKMVTNDYTVKILARETDQKEKPIVEPYLKTRLELKQKDLIIPTFNVKAEEIIFEDKNRGVFTFLAKGPLKKVPIGESIIAFSDFNPLIGKTGEWKDAFAAVRKGDKFKIIDPNIEISGIRAMHNSHQNWAQIIALNYLLDYSVNCVFLQGGAGTGKTLLALAAGLGHKKRGTYGQIIISRPAIPLDPEQQMGYLPGDIHQKMNPWLLPIIQNLKFILENYEKVKTRNDSGSRGESDILDDNSITIQSLDFVRGTTFSNAFIIIDEAQNLTRHQIKTIITRAGEGSKMVFTGDLSQIDNRHLDKNSSGLAYAISKMKHNPIVGAINFKETLRSPLASFAEEVL